MSSNKRPGRVDDIDNNGAGVINYRGWLYSSDEDGNRVTPAPATTYEKNAATELPADGPLVFAMCIRCRRFTDLCECPGARDQPAVESERPSIHEELARLTPREREVWDYQTGNYDREMVRKTILAGELVAAQREGFTLIPGTNREDQRRDGVVVTLVDVEGQEETKRGLSYAEMAERMGVSIAEVNKLVVSMRAKLGLTRKR